MKTEGEKKKKTEKQARAERPDKHAEETRKRLKAIARKNGVAPKSRGQVDRELAASVERAKAERLAKERTIVGLDGPAAKGARRLKPVVDESDNPSNGWREPAPSPRRTIKRLVVETISANPAVTNDEMIAAVKREFPESAFKDTHAAWYRSQARKGLLTGASIAIPAIGRKQPKTAE